MKGLKAIWSPHTGIVDWGLVTEHYGKNFKDAGGEIYLNFEVNKFDSSSEEGYSVQVSSDNQVFLCIDVICNFTFFLQYNP